MEYKKYRDTYYIRLDRGDEVISSILAICKKENILSATFTGIGGCGSTDIQTFIPEQGTFEVQHLEGMLELVSLTGNVITDDKGEYYPHAHGMFAYKKEEQHCITGGHIESITVSYTAEIELHPVLDGRITRTYDQETGTGFWKFK